MQAYGTVIRASAIVVLVATLGITNAASAYDEDFEAYDEGTFPSPFWRDVGLVDPTPPNPPDPSATVEWTIDAFGLDTQALSFAEAIAYSQGIYREVGVSPDYTVAADIRVDRFCNNAMATWDAPIALGVAQYRPQVDPAWWPQVQIYFDIAMNQWRVYVYGTDGLLYYVSLGLGLDLGTWYRAEVRLAAEVGIVGIRIWDTHTGELLLDDEEQVPNWTPENGLFDAVMLFESEASLDPTVSNLTVVDNVSFMPAQGISPGRDLPESNRGIRLSTNPVRWDGAFSWINETAGSVSLKLIDAQGRSVVSRRWDAKVGGVHGLRWSALVGGRDLASGVYFLTITGASPQPLVERVIVAE